MSRTALPIIAVAIVSAAQLSSQIPQRIEYVEDIDDWRVEVFAGAIHPGWVLQGPVKEAGFREPIQMAFLTSGEAVITTDNTVFLLRPDRTVRLVAGVPGQYGHEDGPGHRALFGRQLSVCSDNRGGAYILDRANRCIRRLRRAAGQWAVDTLAGDSQAPPSQSQLARVREEGAIAPTSGDDVIDGTGRAARFTYLHSNVIADSAGNAYVMDADFLRRISPEGEVVTLNRRGGTGSPVHASEPLESAHFRLIMGGGMSFGGDGKIYVADRWNHCIRAVGLRARTVTTALGRGKGYIDGPETEAAFFDSPGYIVYDPYRKRFYTNGVDDWGLRTWQNGRVQTIAGGDRANSSLDGPARAAGAFWCGVLAVDPRPPHDIYFWSNRSNWRGRIGRLFRTIPGREQRP